MAESILSPGVFARENDLSFRTEVAVEAGAAIIGPTVKGPVEIPTLVTSYSDYQNRFGDKIKSGSNYYSYFTSLAVENYFNNGGSSVIITRVVPETFSPATSSAILNTNTSSSFILETLSEGILQNSEGPEVSGSLSSGSLDNLRWEIVGSNEDTGTFSLLIRRGDDNSGRNKIILETWSNLSLDPSQNNYITKVIGDYKFGKMGTGNDITVGLVTGSYPNASRYVRVKSVVSPTIDYFDNNGDPQSFYDGFMPENGSGSFGGAVGNNLVFATKFYENANSTSNVCQGVPTSSYNDAITILRNSDQYSFNVITTPGLIQDSNFTSQINAVINLAQDRGDCFYPLDLVDWSVEAINTVVNKAAGFNTNYAGAYWPWVQIVDNAVSQNVWVPASVVVPGVFAFNDKQGGPWYAPAGINRGGLSSVIRTKLTLSKSNRDSLYSGKVNPIATFPGQGIVILGQKTLQKKQSALDRVNVRRLLIELKRYIGAESRKLVFEQNTTRTRNQFLSIVQPYLESIQQRQGLYAFKIVMDDSNNTPDVIDRQELVGQIYIQPTRAIEYVLLDFNITPTGSTFA